MFEASRSYSLKLEKIIVPMAKGYRSRRVLDMAFDFSHEYNSEITAFTVKDDVREITWSDKVALVTNAYKDGKEHNIKVIPRITTSSSVREGIVKEANTHNYDLLFIASGKRSPLSASLLGGIGDYVLKNSRVTTIAASLKNRGYPYEKILIPVSEYLNTRTAISFALHLKKSLNAKIFFADLRKYDRKRTHGFNLLFDNMDEVINMFGPEIEVLKSGMSSSITDEVEIISRNVKPNVVILGVKSDQTGRVRINSAIKSIIKESDNDAILVKK